MQNPKMPIYIMIGGATLGIVLILAWILGAFSSNDTKSQAAVIETNNIVSSVTLPQSCQDVMTLMRCILDSDQLTGANHNAINSSYQQLLSERNVITDQSALQQQCATQYTYITSLESTGYQTIISSCL